MRPDFRTAKLMATILSKFTPKVKRIFFRPRPRGYVTESAGERIAWQNAV